MQNTMYSEMYLPSIPLMWHEYVNSSGEVKLECCKKNN